MRRMLRLPNARMAWVLANKINMYGGVTGGFTRSLKDAYACCSWHNGKHETIRPDINLTQDKKHSRAWVTVNFPFNAMVYAR